MRLIPCERLELIDGIWRAMGERFLVPLSEMISFQQDPNDLENFWIVERRDGDPVRVRAKELRIVRIPATHDKPAQTALLV